MLRKDLNKIPYEDLDENYKKINIVDKILNTNIKHEIIDIFNDNKDLYIFDKNNNIINIGDLCEIVLKGKRKKYKGYFYIKDSEYIFNIIDSKIKYINLKDIDSNKLVNLEEENTLRYIMECNEYDSNRIVYNIKFNNAFEKHWLIWYLDKNRFSGFGLDILNNCFDEKRKFR